MLASGSVTAQDRAWGHKHRLRTRRSWRWKIEHSRSLNRRRCNGADDAKGFKKFLMRGNVVDLAVAVVIGGAFGAVVAALVKDLLTPLIAAIVGKPDFSAIVFTVNGSKFLIGDFINAVVAFVLVAAAIYFFVVLPMNMVMERRRRGEAPPDPTTGIARSASARCPSPPAAAPSARQPLEVAGAGR